MTRKKRRVNNYNIVVEVCDYYCITEQQFFSKSRKRTLALARQMAMYLMRYHGTVSTYIGIKDFFEFRNSIKNHATVIHAVKIIELELTYNKDLKEALYFGSDKAKLNTFYAAYNAKMTDLNKIPGSTPYHLHKETLKAIKLSLKSMSPVGISAYTSKGRVVSKKAHFIRWVEDKYGKKAVRELKKAEADYQYLIRKFWRLVQKKEHWDKLSAYASQKNLIIR